MYEQLLCAGDVTLDPFPFGGGITLSDSIRCNVPFVTSPMLQAVHSIGTGIARLMSDVMIADTAANYVQKAKELGYGSRSCRSRGGAFHKCGTSATHDCAIQEKLCANKHKLFATGRTEVTEEWNEFLANAHRLHEVR